MSLKVEERKDFHPICPHCDGSIKTLVKMTHGQLERHKIYCCPHCRKILGIGSSSG